MPYQRQPWMTVAELEKFCPIDDACPENLKADWMAFFLDLYDLLMKFGIERRLVDGKWMQMDHGIEQQDSGEVLLGLTSRPMNMLMFTPADPEDRIIVICDPEMSDAESAVYQLPNKARVVWGLRYSMQQVIDFMREIDDFHKERIDPHTKRRTKFRVVQH